MSTREFIALGTSSQAPTRERSHNSYLLLWDGEGFLFDPGEGTQRQLTLAGVAASSIHHICITHFHGDHCLGLAGVVQRLSLDRCDHPVHVYYPESGQVFFERLCGASIYLPQTELIPHPVGLQADAMIELWQTDTYALRARALDHSVSTFGLRLEEAPGLRFVPEKLDLAGVRGPMVGELRRHGRIQAGGRMVPIEEVTVHRPGSVFAFVMDTRPCVGADALAKDADLLVMEATYTSEHQDLAAFYFHSTAADAAKTAQRAGAHRLALTHFSQRYPDTGQHLAEAREIFDNVITLNDLDRVVIPRRPSGEQASAGPPNNAGKH
jgi:ribonuclease Z